MGVRLIESNQPAEGYTVMYCSTSMTAFGPVFHNYQDAEDFLESLPCDPRSISANDLEQRYDEFMEQRRAEASAEE